MHAERKKEIRSLIKTIPQLVKSGLVTQAFETEKIIASTFDFSKDFLSKLGGIPQNYIEGIQDIYGDMLEKGYDTGYKSAEVKIKSTPFDRSLPDDEFDREIEIRMPMSFGVKQNLVEVFRSEISKYFTSAQGETLPEVIIQFEKDLNAAYKDGVKQYLTSMPEEVLPHPDEQPVEPTIEIHKEIEVIPPVEEPKEDAGYLEEYKGGDEDLALDYTAKLAAGVFNKCATNDLKALFDAHSEAGMHKANAKLIVEFAEWVSDGKDATDYIPDETFRVVADTISKELLDKLEKYAKLLGEGDPETVLRYTLGLGEKGTKAADKKVDKRVKAEVEKEEAEPKAEPKEKEEAEPKAEPKEKESEPTIESSTYARLEAYTKLLNNPEAERVLRYTLGLPPKKATASIPHGPQGVLTKSDQSQIEGLLSLGKSRTYKDIRKASPKLSSYLSKTLNDIRMSKISLLEGLSKLKSNMEDMVADCFGNDGQDYYNYLKNK